MIKSKINLLRDLVLLLPIKAKQTSENGIIITSVDKGAPQEGIVLAIGPGETDKKGKLIPMTVAPGDRVVFIPTEAREIKQDEDKLLVISESDILCKMLND